MLIKLRWWWLHDFCDRYDFLLSTARFHRRHLTNENDSTEEKKSYNDDWGCASVQFIIHIFPVAWRLRIVSQGFSHAQKADHFWLNLVQIKLLISDARIQTRIFPQGTRCSAGTPYSPLDIYHKGMSRTKQILNACDHRPRINFEVTLRLKYNLLDAVRGDSRFRSTSKHPRTQHPLYLNELWVRCIFKSEFSPPKPFTHS